MNFNSNSGILVFNLESSNGGVPEPNKNVPAGRVERATVWRSIVHVGTKFSSFQALPGVP